MKNTLSIITFLFLVSTVPAQTIFGNWESTDLETNKVDSVINIYEKDGKAYAKIISINDPNGQTAVCDKCEGENKNKPMLGLNILYGLSKDKDEWSGGKILDPRNGKEYTCYIKLDGKNKLKIRGYIGFAMFGRTTYWYRAK